MGSITWIDVSLFTVFLTLIVLLFMAYEYNVADRIRKYFIPGFLIKVVGGVFFAIIYVYYYKFGDTFLYYRGARVLGLLLIESPLDYFSLIFAGSDALPKELATYTMQIDYSKTPEEWFMVKLLSPLSILAYHSYLTLTLFMSTLAFFGSWKLFRVFDDMLPSRTILSFGAVFLIPSVVFWSSGIMKDTLTFVGFCFLLNILYFNFLKGEFSFLKIMIALFWAFIIFKLKAYILIAFLPTIFFIVYYKYVDNIRSSFIKFLVRPVLFLSIATLIILSLRNLTVMSEKYDVDRLKGSVQGFHSWHTTQGGSVYNLGEVELTPLGLISKIPAALNVTFFRPYFWEYASPVILMSAAESFTIFCLFLLVIWKSGFRPFHFIRSNSLLKALLFFIVIFGFAVGFTTYNFGALARYKIPIMPCFVFTLLFIYAKIKAKGNHSAIESP